MFEKLCNKTKLPFDGRRIKNGENLEYVRQVYHCLYPALIETKTVRKITPLLQRDFGDSDDNDCTLTTITCLTNYLSQEKYSTNEIYAWVNKTAEKFLYNPNIGTIPFFIKKILDKTRALYIEEYELSKQSMIKGVGFTFEDIVSRIRENMPVILNISSDGRNFYSNHTVLVVGYHVYRDEKDVKYKFLMVYDNWLDTYSIVDYERLNSLCSINYLVKKK